MKPLPRYVTDLKGAGCLKRRYGTFAEWCFNVPHDGIADFESYLEVVGVPREYFLKDAIVPLPDAILKAKPGEAAKELGFFRSAITKADVNHRGGGLIKKGEAIIYMFINPNISNTTIDLDFDRGKGFVRIREYGPFKD